MAPRQYLIIGHGAAGISAAEAIRGRDPGGRIVIASDERYPFYSRPGVAYVLTGQVPAERLFARRPSFYEAHHLELVQDTVRALDPARRVAQFEKSGAVSYDVVLVATGSVPVPPRFPGADLAGFMSFDSLDDAKALIRAAGRARAAVVVGGGITAMELAEGLRRLGPRVHLLQRQDRLWPRLFNEHEAALVAGHAVHEGIEILYREEVAEAIGKNGRLAAVRLRSGRELACQIGGVAIGTRPNMAAIAGTEIRVDQGIMVDEFMQTSVPGVFAAGDVAQAYDRWTGSHQLDTLWPTALAMGRHAGHNMVDVAHGRAPTQAYVKGLPFNACLLFGVHITIIGRVGDSGRGQEVAEEPTLSMRGSSNIFTKAFGPDYRSAWDGTGANSLRLVLSDGHIMGALLIGSQDLADPLRDLIEHEADVRPEEADLLSAGPAMRDAVRRAWERWRAAGGKA
jgi:NAD(P)H-nitrite reductase large subunit